MKLYKELDNGEVMTLCVHCNHITHTYRNDCTCCGKHKKYDFFFSLPKNEREKLLGILLEYNEQSE